MHSGSATPLARRSATTHQAGVRSLSNRTGLHIDVRYVVDHDKYKNAPAIVEAFFSLTNKPVYV